MNFCKFVSSLILFVSSCPTVALIPSQSSHPCLSETDHSILTNQIQSTTTGSRKAFVRSIASGFFISGLQPWISFADDNVDRSPSSNTSTKLFSDEEIKKIVKSDMLERQFLATGKLTRSIYQPTAKFTDEIDTYDMEQWIKGTQKLFVGDKSVVRLIGDIMVTPDKIEFRFDEDLMFNIPFRPVVALSGTVILERNPETGLITSYREFWDQDVLSVLKTAKF